jgi:hypothetical protein
MATGKVLAQRGPDPMLETAISLLVDLLQATGARAPDGTRLKSECLGCTRTGVHKPERTCNCACHQARRFLIDITRKAA